MSALPDAPSLGDDPTVVDLAITGMTCASCANRIERRLNKLDGVEASVNYAMETAHVVAPAGTEIATLVAEVEAAGYAAAPPASPGGAPGSEGHETGSTGHEGHHAEEPIDELRRRLLISAALTVPVVLMAMVPALQFENWQWLSLTLAAPVVLWGAWPFHRAAWVNLRHGAATMDTLVSVGTLAAFGWSLYALFIGDAGMPGMTMPFELDHRPGLGDRRDLLRGRRRRHRRSSSPAGTSRPGPSVASGAALAALLDLGAKDVAVLRDGDEIADPDRPAGGGGPVRRPSRREDRDRRGRRRRHLGDRRVAPHG